MNQAHISPPPTEPTLFSGNSFRQLSPASMNCLDLSLCRFSNENWLAALLQKQEVIISMQVETSAAAKVVHLYTQQRNQLRKNGQAPIGIGYPLVKWGQITAPLLIWQITLDLSPDTGSSWFINYREPFQSCFINPIIAQRLQEESGFSWNQWELSHKIDPHQIIADVLRLTDQEWSFTEPDFVPIPSKRDDNEDNSTLELIHAAVLGSFFPVSIHQITPYPFEWNRFYAEKRRHPFTLKELDPWQVTAWRNMTTEALNVVNGPSGAGKRHLTQAIISNALSNGEKCLIVDAHFSSAQAFIKRLEMDGLQRLVYFQREPRTEEVALWKLLIAEQKTTKNQSRFSEAAFEQLLQKLTRLDDLLNKSYQVLRKPVISKYNWTEAVGLFLENHRQERRELLGTLLQPSDFIFDEAQFAHLQELINRAFPLFQSLRTFSHPLQALHTDVFLKKNIAPAAQWTNDKLQSFVHRLGGLLHEYITGITQYGDNLRTVLEQTNKVLRTQLETVMSALELGEQNYGSSFLTATTSQLRLQGALFSNKRNLRIDRDEVINRYEVLKESYRRNAYFDFEWLPLTRIKNLQQVKSLAHRFQSALQEWQQQFPQYVHEEVLRLSSKTVQQGLTTASLPQNLEEKMEALLLDLDETKLLNEPVTHNFLTLQKRQQFLEQIQGNLEQLIRNMRDFELFYPWQRFWLTLSETEKKLIRALANIKTSDWNTAFKSWFLHQALQNAHDISLPDDRLSLGEYRDLWEHFCEMLPLQIRSLWQDNHNKTLKLIKKDKNWGPLVNSRNAYFKEGDLYAGGGKWLTDRFPVWVTSPEAALYTFQQQSEPLFDWVVINNLTELSTTIAQQLTQLAKRCVFFGEGEAQIALADDNLSDILPIPVNVFQLKGIHHYYPANLQQVFYGHYFTEMALSKSFKWTIKQVKSKFNSTNWINLAEVNAVINWILNLENSGQLDPPNIAIVATTIAQRDAIASAIYELRRKPSSTSTFIQQLERNGLGVYHLSELAGLKADLMIVSLTFGPDEHSEMGAEIDVLNSTDHVKWLQLLMQIAEKEVFLIHSLPPNTLRFIAEDQNKEGGFLLGNYVLLAQAWNQGDLPTQEHIADRLLKWRPPIPLENPAPIFWDELTQTLRPYLSVDRMARQPQAAPIQLPLMIKSAKEGDSPIAMIADGFFANTPFTDFSWEQAQRRWLNQNGWKCLPVWSVNFWKNPDQEGRKIAGQIIRLEKS